VAGASKRVIYAALAGNTLIAITKFAAAVYTGSSAMLSEGIHSVVDTGNQALLLHGLKRAQWVVSRQLANSFISAWRRTGTGQENTFQAISGRSQMPQRTFPAGQRSYRVNQTSQWSHYFQTFIAI